MTTSEVQDPFILKSISASAIKKWEECPASAGASSINKVPQGPMEAADLGSACHAALEAYVKAVHMEHSIAPSENLLLQLYQAAYLQYFGNTTGERFQAGLDMMRKWYARTDFTDREVLSVEVKKNFQVPTSQGMLTFNYIFDRVDRRIGTNDIEVIDYKSWIMPRNTDNMQDDPQMRAYALAGAIEYKAENPERVWVLLDQLRYDSVGTVFTREQNKATWIFIQEKAEDMIFQLNSDEPLQEKLNPLCAWCIRRHSCATMAKHEAVTGPLSFTDVNDVTNRLSKVQALKKAAEAMEVDLNTWLVNWAQQNGDLEYWETPEVSAQVTFSKRRGVDPQMVANVIGPELFSEMGKINMSSVDDLLKGNKITPEQKTKLRSLLVMNYGDPKIKTKNRGGLSAS